MSIRYEIVDRLIDALHSSGREHMWEMLTEELRVMLDPLPEEERYMVGLTWLDWVHQQLDAAGVVLPALSFLRVLIRAGGDELDQTVFLPTGVQQISLN